MHFFSIALFITSCDQIPSIKDSAQSDLDTCGVGEQTKIWYLDFDSDGYGDPLVVIESCIPPDGYVLDHTDCDDSNANVNPREPETCEDGIDNDCNPTNDTTGSTWYQDADGDAYGNTAVWVVACTPPSGYVLDDSDCDDADASTFPGADEFCDGQDNDCDALTDESDAVDAQDWYRDADGDGYGNAALVVISCEAPVGYVGDATDCDDTQTSAHPGGYEAYYDIANPGSGAIYCGDGVDNDCDGNADSADTECADEDADGIADRVDYLFPCDPDGDDVNEAACLRASMLWVSPWDSVDCIQQESDFTMLLTSGQNALVSVTWGGETFDVCPIYPTSVSTSIDARAVSSLGTDGSSVVDTTDCSDWEVADLSVYCVDWPDTLCTTKTSSDGCATVGKVISFAYDGTEVTP